MHKLSGICDHCLSTNVSTLNPFYLVDGNGEPTEEIEGYHVECNECYAFWDERVI